MGELQEYGLFQYLFIYFLLGREQGKANLCVLQSANWHNEQQWSFFLIITHMIYENIIFCAARSLTAFAAAVCLFLYVVCENV